MGYILRPHGRTLEVSSGGKEISFWGAVNMVSCPSPEGSVVFRTVVRNALAMALALRTLTKRWSSHFGALEVQLCYHQIKGPPQYVSIRSSFWRKVAAAELDWTALCSHLQTKILHFAQVFATC